MPIKIFEGNDIKALESQVNEFTKDKKVLNPNMSSVGFGDMVPMVPMTKHQILIQYESLHQAGEK